MELLPSGADREATILRKSARRRVCALMGVHGAALDIKDIDHIFNSEHECALLILPRTMASMVIFT
jgi:hypothetical protein